MVGRRLVRRGLSRRRCLRPRASRWQSPWSWRSESSPSIATPITGAISRSRQTPSSKAPGNERAHNNLGTALIDCKQIDAAIAEYQKAVDIDPDYARAHYNLGAALVRQGKIAAAIGQWDEAFRLQPDNLLTLNQLASLLATSSEASVRNGARAVELARRAAQLSGGQDANILGTLAAAYAEAGRFSDAVKTAQRALALAVRQKNQALANVSSSPPRSLSEQLALSRNKVAGTLRVPSAGVLSIATPALC